MPTQTPIKVLAVDDSALMRRMLTAMVNAQPDMQMVATAPDPYAARELIKQHNPDVLTLDVEMPRMNGIEFLSHLMRLRPMPVVMLSSLTERGSRITVQALELGAVDFVAKPGSDVAHGLAEASTEIIDKLRTAARARITRQPMQPAARLRALTFGAGSLIAIGASTGGVEALKRLLEPLPAAVPPILVTQHMPARFTTSFAQRLDALCAATVKEASDGEQVQPGHVYIAPGGAAHMLLVRNGAGYRLALSETPPINRHRPSVDALFHSVASQAGARAVGILLTGMGADGADGMVALRAAGAWTIAQDQATSVVYGMPAAAVARGGACLQLPLPEIAARALELVARKPRASKKTSAGETDRNLNRE